VERKVRLNDTENKGAAEAEDPGEDNASVDNAVEAAFLGVFEIASLSLAWLK
jgi:hypothetical protein